MKINKKIFKKTVLLSLIASFLVVNIYVPHKADAVASQDASQDDTIDAIASTEKELKKATQTLNIANSNYVKVASQVKTTSSLLKETANEIARKEGEIKNLNDQVVLYKTMLSAYLQEVYFGNQDQTIKLAVANESLDAIFSNDEQMLNVKEKILRVLDEIDASQNKLVATTDELADEKAKHEKLLQQKKAEQGEIISDIKESQATIAELNDRLDKLRSTLSSFLGKSYDTKDIDDAVSFASKATGIRKEFLQAELIVETGYGTFTGGCTYKKIRMKSADVTEFLKIAAELTEAYGGDYKNKKLSCSPSWGGYGGAMGVAQFMPTTWIGYKAKISSKTGSNPADPWDLADGITGMAIKLANAGATSKSGEKMASKRYYCGGPSSPYWNTKCEEYAKKVQYFSKDPESHM